MATSKTRKWVYQFSEGSAKMRDLLGGKGAGAAEMTRAGMPVPPGFTLTTEACREYYARGRKFPEGLWEQVLRNLKTLERKAGKRFGDPHDPLLVSVRSGAKFSMPGMMDTVLNLGLNEETTNGLAALTKNERFALDSRRRFIQMFGKTVKGIDGDKFEHALQQAKKAAGVKTDPELKAEDRSWNTDRAKTYRRMERIPDDLGTAVNVQMMVFGNMGKTSGTGVAFTRNPISGARELYGDYLPNAQGEDVVAGVRDTLPIKALKRLMPKVYAEFEGYARKLEKHYRDVQDLEFTIERGKLWMLQTRSAKRTGEAAVNIAVDMVGERLITKKEAVARIEPRQLEQLLFPRVDPNAKVHAIAKGVPASPGAASGAAVFDADTAVEWGKKGKAVILVRVETNPNDVHGMVEAKGILTQTGGTASHAALVARGMGRPCVVGASSISVDVRKRVFSADGTTIKEGEEITIDGTTGEVYVGKVPTIEAQSLNKHRSASAILRWADTFRRLEVWANADYPRDAIKARENGAQGVGLCRTEHMFMEQDRLPIVQAMIMATTTEEREKQLALLLPIQRGDFEGIFQAMAGLPVIIRLIDPPLHEFLPSLEELIREITELKVTGKTSRGAARGEPDARPARSPPLDPVPRDHAHAGAGDHGSGLRLAQEEGRRETGDHDPARRHARGSAQRAPGAEAGSRSGAEGKGRSRALQVRHHDRNPACGAHRGRDRGRGRVLLLRHQRPDADDVRLLTRRRRAALHRQVPRAEDPAAQPVRDYRRERRRPADGDCGDRRAQDAAKDGDRHLRRARRRPRVDPPVSLTRPELRLVQPVPRAGGTAGRGPGRHRQLLQRLRKQ